ncbi:hypothetical protein [Tolypothrix sp. NIES-4075]|uniref:hypothetical protein n=1 Tax=Tolypothrix sp. NIES-4075 TaxID=2005459 RepID=UPI00118100A4|nr:hypothetical protein [Tolypothrix sp. NIES-4075]
MKKFHKKMVCGKRARICHLSEKRHGRDRSPDRSFYPADFAVLTALVFLIMMRIFNRHLVEINSALPEILCRDAKFRVSTSFPPDV